MRKNSEYASNSLGAKTIIIDNGHGVETAGKRSPDGTLREFRWCRDFAKMLKDKLEYYGYNAILLVPEDNDIYLSARAKRANKIYEDCNRTECVLVSIHNNAAGNGSEWINATGFEVYTSPGNTKSDKLAELMYQEASLFDIKLRKDYSDGDSDKEDNFTILTKTLCPAILTENMFMDSKKDVAYLNSEEGIHNLLKIHVNAIRRYFEDPNGTHQSWIDMYKETKCNYK